MVLVGLALASIFLAALIGRRTLPFDALAFMGTLVVSLVVSMTLLGVLSLHSEQWRVTHQVENKIINLNNGVALQKKSGEGLYITYASANFTTGCDEIGVTEVQNKTYPYLLGIVVTTSTHYDVCLPDPDNPALNRDSS